MISNSMFENIKKDLADNYDGNDEVLKTKIDRATTIALSVSNRLNNEENLKVLAPYIEEFVKGQYENRVAEGLSSLSQGGTSSNFRDLQDKMRNDIIKDGNRKLFKC